jgi:hypothetical protein
MFDGYNEVEVDHRSDKIKIFTKIDKINNIHINIKISIYVYE